MIGLARGQTPHNIASAKRPPPPPYTTVQPAELAHQTKVETAGIATYELLVSGVMGGSVIILISLLFSMTVNERRRHLGLLRSLGATKRLVFRSVFMEAALVALFGGVLGLALGEVVLIRADGAVESTLGVTL